MNGRHEAGIYAEERYKRGLRSWRSRSRPMLMAVFGPFILAGLVMLEVEGHPISWTAGLVTGAFIGAWITIQESPPAHVENWHVGAEGERKTEKAMRQLERESWRVTHDVQTRYGNYDHIAVGPAGVFLLETKNPRGIVRFRHGTPHLERRDDRRRRGAGATAAWRLARRHGSSRTLVPLARRRGNCRGVSS